MKTFLMAGLTALMLTSLASGASSRPARPATPAPAPIPTEQMATRLRDQALNATVGYQFLSDLTTRIGARPPGSEREKAAAEWAVAELTRLGFSNAHIETFPYHPWVRGAHDSIEITAPFPQKLVGVALGGSSGTGAEGLEAEAVLFDSMQAFVDSKDDVTGKIVVILQPMPRANDGAGYGAMSGAIRWRGPILAQQRGAAGFVLRSVGTGSQRFAHAGATAWSDNKGIPSMAISAPDAETLSRIAALQRKGEAGPVRLRMVSTPTFPGEGTSVNVVADVPGSEHPEEVIIIGGHLDSWDLGTGAIDDGAGMAIAVGTAKAILDAPQKPKRTVRVVFWGSEEMSQPAGFGTGGDAFARAHAADVANMVVTLEGDFGANRAYRLTLPETADAEFPKMASRLVTPLGIVMNREPSTSGDSDTDSLYRLGVPAIHVEHDGYDYFDIHHTADDVLERVEPAALNQVIAAWTALIWSIADSDIDFVRPTPKAQ